MHWITTAPFFVLQKQNSIWKKLHTEWLQYSELKENPTLISEFLRSKLWYFYKINESRFRSLIGRNPNSHSHWSTTISSNLQRVNSMSILRIVKTCNFKPVFLKKGLNVSYFCSNGISGKRFFSLFIEMNL